MTKFHLLGFMQKEAVELLAKTSFQHVAYLDLVAVLLPVKKLSLLSSKRDRLIGQLEPFQKALETLLTLGAIVPSVFGKEFAGALDLLPVLAGNAAKIRQLLSNYGSKHQYQIDISWNVEAAIAHFQGDIKSNILNSSQAGDDSAPNVGLELKAGLETVRTRIEMAASEILTATGQEHHNLPRAGDETIASFVTLWDAGCDGAFDQMLESIDALNTDLLKIKVKGPLPACSFASVEPVKLGTIEIMLAGKLLGIHTSDDAASIKDAYRNFMKRNHPDVGGSVKQSQTGKDAYSLLQEFIEVRDALSAAGSAIDSKSLTALRVHRDGEVRRAA